MKNDRKTMKKMYWMVRCINYITGNSYCSRFGFETKNEAVKWVKENNIPIYEVKRYKI